MEYHTKDASDTQELGRALGARLKGGEVLALSGDLGAGKTTFVQGLCQGLCIESRIISPTFILMRTYPSPKGFVFYHVDLYRLEGDLGDELNGLGITDVWGKEGTVVAIEWAEKAKKYIPEKAIWITFLQKGDSRKITIHE